MPAPAWGMMVTTPHNESFAASLSLLLLPTMALMQMSPEGWDSFLVGLYLFIYKRHIGKNICPLFCLNCFPQVWETWPLIFS